MELPIKQVRFLQTFERLYLKLRQSLDLLLLPFDSLYDLVCFYLHCRLSPFTPKSVKETYDLIFFSHSLEKGLSLPETRPLFGKNNISRILHLLRISEPDTVRNVGVQMAIGSIKEYLDFHQKLGVSDQFLIDLESEINSVSSRHKVSGNGGTKDVSNLELKIRDGVLKYEEFLLSRYSCRNFQKKLVPQELVTKIIHTAQQAPSQCNRQSARVHLYQEKDKIAQLLTLQGGSRGFADDVMNLLVISDDLNSWVARGERNQCYVDGGLFAMAILYSCHAYGIGSCPLNFSKTGRKEHEFKKVADIPSHERVVMLIAIGFPTNKVVAARSIRSPLDQVLKIH